MSSTLRRCTLRLLKNERRHFSNVGKSSFSKNFRVADNAKLSTNLGKNLARMVHSMAEPSLVTSKDESRELMALWPDVVRDLTTNPTEKGLYTDIPDVSKWLGKVLQYVVPNGKKNRGLALVTAYKKFAQPNDLTEDNLRLARILAWCTELCQAYLILEDDIIDRAKTRRGLKCWYLNNDVGLAAINDGIYLEQAVYQLLKKHFDGKPCYVNLMETFHDSMIKTTIGQIMDGLTTETGKRPNLDLFTMDRYNAIAKYKTGYYTFAMPVSLAMYLAGITDPEMHRQSKMILLEMGQFYQAQDDYLDCYGDPRIIGKASMDIEEGKCTWLSVVALQRATPAQRKIFQECYGTSDPEKIARIKQLYDDLGLPTTYSIYEEESYNLMTTHIQQISRGLPHDLFFKFLSMIYRRDA